MTSKHKHPFHLVDPSPWPLLTAGALLITVIGVVLALHTDVTYLLWCGLLGLVICLSGWWRDVITESKTEHTRVTRRGLSLGVVMFIISEACLFAAFFAAYGYAAFLPNEASGFVWPPTGVKLIDPLDLPYLNTLILLLSGAILNWSHDDLLQGKTEQAAHKLMLTILLGVAFVGVQAYEYTHAPFGFKDGIYPSNFYMITGFHGLHVIVGVVFLLVSWARLRLGHFTHDDHLGFEAAAWYWHFVDVVWLFVFIGIYILGSR